MDILTYGLLNKRVAEQAAQIDKNVADIDELKGDLNNSGVYKYEPNESIWESGGWVGSNPTTDSTRIRTKSSLQDQTPNSQFSGFKTVNNFECAILAFTTEGSYLGTLSKTGEIDTAESGITWHTEFHFKIPYDYRYRLVARDGSDTSATLSVADAENIEFIYSVPNTLSKEVDVLKKKMSDISPDESEYPNIVANADVVNDYVISKTGTITANDKGYYLENIPVEEKKHIKLI